jgi:hypothetical protein
MVKRVPFIRSDIYNFTSATMWTAGEYMLEISFGQTKITDHTATPFTIPIKSVHVDHTAHVLKWEMYISLLQLLQVASASDCVS